MREGSRIGLRKGTTRLGLEPLEAREVPAVFSTISATGALVINITTDPGGTSVFLTTVGLNAVLRINNAEVKISGTKVSARAADITSITVSGSNIRDDINLDRVNKSTFIRLARQTVINGNEGNDRIAGTMFSDKIDGGKGADEIYGNEGNDIIYGGRGADVIFGGAGEDRINGGGGRDSLSGGTGRDILFAYIKSEDTVSAFEEYR